MTPSPFALGPLLVLWLAACAGAQPSGQRGETFEGRVSYYSDRLAGRSTASGEPYRPELFTAASPSLPFGTRLRVTRLSPSGEAMASVEVRVNDRGPNGGRGRILDLSRAAAEALDMIRAGVVTVRVEVLGR
ncbi:MAG: septal ring lytic transglycosylase RlpA family protein [Myxococcota bacterium]